MSSQTKEQLHRSLVQIVGLRNVVVEKGELGKYSRSVLVINPEIPSLVTTTPTTVVRPAATSEVVAVVPTGFSTVSRFGSVRVPWSNQ